MHDILSRTGIFSLRNLMAYRVIGSTITEKLGEQLTDIDFIVPVIGGFMNPNNLHCLSCISYDILSTALLAYIISFHYKKEVDTLNRIEKLEGLAKLRKIVGKSLWIILFILTKNVEHAS